MDKGMENEELLKKKELLMKCNDFNGENIYLSILLAEDIDELKNRLSFCKKYVDDSEITVGSMTISSERFSEYEQLFFELKLDDLQCKKIMREIVLWGNTAKRAEIIRKDVSEMSVFDVPVDIRNKFVVENSQDFFNDFSRHFDDTFHSIIEKYGKEDGFKYLCEHPECLRWGYRE